MLDDLQQYAQGNMSAKEVIDKHQLSDLGHLHALLAEHDLTPPSLPGDLEQKTRDAFEKFIMKKIKNDD